MGEKKQLLLNMTAAIVTFVVQAGINFVLTPYITAELGAEAYGFVTLSNTLVGYISIVTVAVTSMSSRFISIEMYKENDTEAGKYYSSTLGALVIFVLLFAIPCVFCIAAIDYLLKISPNLVFGVQVLMVLVLANFSLKLMSSNLGIGFYVKNKLYIGSVINAFGFIIQAILMVVMFSVLPVSVTFIGVAMFLSTSLVQYAYYRFKRRLLPDVKFHFEDMSLSYALTVVKAGIWNSISQLGSVLSMGFDMIVCNLFLGGIAMGVLSISRVVRQAVDSMGAALIGAFQPTLTKYYASDDINGFVAYAKWAMKAFGFVIALPVGGFIAFGTDFFALWVPSQDTSTLYPLAFIAIVSWAVLAPAAVVHNIFTVINRVKTDSLFICFGGFLIVATECALLYMTDLGVYAIALTSCLEAIIRNLVYTIPAGARYLGKPWWTFFPCVGQSFLCTSIVVVCGLLLRHVFIPTSWMALICEGLLCVGVGGIICLFILFDKQDRVQIRSLLLRRIRKQGD